MPRRLPRGWLLAAPLVFILYFYGLTSTGLLGPDEPRYASVAREMARSGDWITPRLWGAPWFEKPPLLYWMTGAGFRLGLGEDLAPRIPVALLAVAFLVLYQRVLAREFGERAGWYSTAVLGTSVGWLGLSRIGVTDMPMAAAYFGAMLLSLAWVKDGDRRALPAAGALLGAAVLAKGLVPLVLAAPLAWSGRRHWRDLAHPRFWGPALAVAAPWYLWCTARNGRPFLVAFFWEQHFSRFFSGALLHGQPFWFYVPVLLVALLPWTPLLPLGFARAAWRDPRARFLMLVAGFGLLFFSASTNKLPGYLLPLLPAVAALIGVGLANASRLPGRLAACGVCLLVFPLLWRMLPAAVASGIRRAPLPQPDGWWLVPIVMGAAAWFLEYRARRGAGVALIAAATALGVAGAVIYAGPVLDRSVSARHLWQQVRSRRDQVCVAGIHRSWRYGLNYYSIAPLPDCAVQPAPLEIRQQPGAFPTVSAGAGLTASKPAL